MKMRSKIICLEREKERNGGEGKGRRRERKKTQNFLVSERKDRKGKGKIENGKER